MLADRASDYPLSMAIELSGKPILITGASSGIGRATALLCSRAGMPVFVTARRADRLDELVKEITSQGGKAASFAHDVSDEPSCREAVQRCIDAFGTIYSVFANAGYGIERPVHEMIDADVRRMFEVNFFGSLNIIRPALPYMIQQRRGHVLMCSSCLGKFSIPYFGVYSATKAAQNHIGRAMNLELRSHGLHVSTVHPISTKTEFFDTAQKLSGDKPMVEHTNEMFVQPPTTVAKAIVRCLRRPRPEVWTSFPVQLGMAMGMVIPRICDRFLMRMVRDYEAAHGKKS